MEEDIKPATQETTETAPAAPTKKPGVLENRQIRLALIALGALVLVAAATYALRPHLLAATVNGEPVSRLALLAELERRHGREMLDDLITDTLIRQEAVRAGVSVPPSAVDEEIAGFRAQLEAQGQTLDAYLASQNLTLAFIAERILLREQLNALLAERAAVSDEDVGAFIETNAEFLPEGVDPADAEFRAQVKESLEQQKFSTAAGEFIEELRAKADIRYFRGE